MADFTIAKDFFRKIGQVVKSLPPVCQNCKQGTLSEKGGVLECTFCKNPKKA